MPPAVQQARLPLQRRQHALGAGLDQRDAELAGQGHEIDESVKLGVHEFS